MNCPICLEIIKEDVEENQKAILSCGHEFHPRCILQWFHKKTSCPSCRKSHVEQSEDVSAPAPAPSMRDVDSLINETIASMILTSMRNSNFQSPNINPLSNLSFRLDNLTNDGTDREIENTTIPSPTPAPAPAPAPAPENRYNQNSINNLHLMTRTLNSRNNMSLLNEIYEYSYRSPPRFYRNRSITDLQNY